VGGGRTEALGRHGLVSARDEGADREGIIRVKLAYGEEGLWVELPDRNVTVVESDFVPGISAEDEAIREAVRAPLGTPPVRDLVGGDDTVAIVFSDLTRPQPREIMLSVLLEELSHVPRKQIVLINALGTHRPSTEAELVNMLGSDLVENYRVVQHDAWDQKGMVHVGETSRGHKAFVNGEYMRPKARILTGLIEPHLFAGFSGGPKAVLPGVADARTVQANHGASMAEPGQADHRCLCGGDAGGTSGRHRVRRLDGSSGGSCSL